MQTHDGSLGGELSAGAMSWCMVRASHGKPNDWRSMMKTGMNAIAALLALALPFSAAMGEGQSINFQLGDVAAKLHDAPCENAKIQQLLPPDSPQFRAAEVLWQGHALAACWAVMGNQIFVVDETGDSGFLSPAGFHAGQKAV